MKQKTLYVTQDPTPGKWQLRSYDISKEFSEAFLSTKQWVVCASTDDTNPNGQIVALCGPVEAECDQLGYQTIADACLMAAAPEMLAALKEMRGLLLSMVGEGIILDNSKAYKMVRDAIEKAETFKVRAD